MGSWISHAGFRVYADKVNIFHQTVQRHVDGGRGDDIAVLWDDGQWTYGELLTEVERLSSGLAAIGVKRGDKIVLRSRNLSRAVASVLAIYRLGAVAVWSNSLLVDNEVDHVVENSEARFAITTDELAAPLRRLRQAGALDRIVIIDGEAGEGELSYESVLAQAAAIVPAADTDALESAFMLYSSGTTGKAKGILHAHRWIITVGDPALVQAEFGRGDVVLTPGEFSFMGNFGHAFSFPLYAGAAIALFDKRATPQVVFEAVHRTKATVLATVPTFYRTVLAEAEPQPKNLIASLRYALATGETLGSAIYNRWVAQYGIPLYEMYGVSEVEVLIGNGPSLEVKPGSIGKAMLGVKIALLDESFEPVKPGEPGILMIHRSDPGLFLGYHRQPEKWRQQHRGDWYFTGDVMRQDEDGYFWTEGRADDLFKSRGYFISPTEIEELLLKQPSVAEAAIVGVQDAKMGNRIAAFVVVRGGHAASDELRERLLGLLRDNLAAYKIPKDFTFVDALPKSPVGKILRRSLRDIAKAA
jgi:acyl-coenzyme A synthetase/AMP-(fatty) acid ligase